MERTIRERHKPAPYLKLKNSKRTSKCHVFSFIVPAQKTQKLDRIGALKGGTFSDFSTFLSQNIKKDEGDPLKLLKSLTMPKKLKRGKTFQNSHFCLKIWFLQCQLAISDFLNRRFSGTMRLFCFQRFASIENSLGFSAFCEISEKKSESGFRVLWSMKGTPWVFRNCFLSFS